MPKRKKKKRNKARKALVLFKAAAASLFSPEDHPRAPVGGVGRYRGGEFVPIDLIEPNPDQPRKHFDIHALQELADSIRQHGLIEPIVVRPHPRDPLRYQIVAGERRWRASRMASHQDIAAIVRHLDDRQVATLALIENVNRQDMNPIEEADGYKALQELNSWDVDELAKQTGKSKQTVENKLALTNLNDRSAAK